MLIIGLISGITGVIAITETYYNRYINYLESKKLTKIQVAQQKIDKIRTGYRIVAINDVMGFTAQRLSSWEGCNEYSWIDEDYIVQTTTDKNDIIYSYSIISLKDDFNLKIRFAPKVTLNSTTFLDVRDSYKSNEGLGSYRIEDGFYTEQHSNLGGTTNYTKIEFTHNFSYSNSMGFLNVNYNNLDRENFSLERINSATYTDFYVSAADRITESNFDKTSAKCFAQEGKGNVLYFEKSNELGEIS